MTPTRKRRLIAVLLILAGISIAGGIAFWSLQQNLLYFQSPNEVAELGMPAGRQFRLGGLVETGSTQRDETGLTVRFTVTDGLKSIPVSYEGILPDLFREGQGVIARGELIADGSFQATEVLAKHDENYMPPEVAAALEKAGHPGPEKADPEKTYPEKAYSEKAYSEKTYPEKAYPEKAYSGKTNGD